MPDGRRRASSRASFQKAGQYLVVVFRQSRLLACLDAPILIRRTAPVVLSAVGVLRNELADVRCDRPSSTQVGRGWIAADQNVRAQISAGRNAENQNAAMQTWLGTFLRNQASDGILRLLADQTRIAS
jgi:hypothetical protein